MSEAAPSRPSTTDETPPPLAFVALVISNLCLAFGPWFVRLSETGPVAAGFWRLALAAPLLLMMTGVTRQPIGRLAPAMLGMIALGGLFFAADLGTWHIGILHTKLANATLFGNTASLIFPIYGFLIARRWPDSLQVVALLLAAVGAALRLGRSYELSAANLKGDLLCLLAGLLYTFYLIAMDRARSTLQPWPVLALSTIAGVVPLLLFAWALGERILPSDWTPLIALALFSQVVGQGLMIYAIGHLKPIVIGLGLLTQPMIAAAVGWIVYDERLSAPDVIGAIAIATALVLVRRTGRRPLEEDAALP